MDDNHIYDKYVLCDESESDNEYLSSHSDDEEVPAKKSSVKTPIVSIQIQGKYIHSNNPIIGKQTLCKMHNTLENIALNLPSLLKFIQINIPDKKFVKEFNLGNIDKARHKIYFICFLNGLIDQLTHNADISINYDQTIMNLYDDIILALIKQTKTMSEYLNFLLKERISRFATFLPNCSCLNMLSITPKLIRTYGYDIHNRLDLVKKLIPDLQNVVNIEASIKSTLKKIVSNLRRIKIKPKNKKLFRVPNHLWTEIFHKHYVENIFPIFIDENNNFVDSSSISNDTLYLYIDEPNPITIYKINLNGHPFCILCDKPKNQLQQIRVLQSGLLQIRVPERELYICDMTCNILALKYYMDKTKPIPIPITISKSKSGPKPKKSISIVVSPRVDMNFLKHRYTKNRLFAFYIGMFDPNCNFYQLIHPDIIYYLVQIYLSTNFI